MTLDSEYFVLIVFILSTLLIWKPLRNSDLRGKSWLFLSLLSYLLSNVFTIVEGWAFPIAFNRAEHAFILLGSLLMLIGLGKSFPGRRDP